MMRQVTIETNRKMAQDGMFSLELLEQVQAYIEEYRNGGSNEAVGAR